MSNCGVTEKANLNGPAKRGLYPQGVIEKNRKELNR